MDGAHKKSAAVIVTELFRLLGRSRLSFAVGLGLALVDAACHAAVPLLFGRVLNLVTQDAKAFVEEELTRMVLVGIGLSVAFVLGALFFHALMMVASVRMAHTVRVSLFSHLQRLPLDFFSAEKTGEISQRLNRDIGELGQSTSVVMGIAWTSCVAVLSLAAMFWLSPLLSGLSVVLLAVVTVFSWHNTSRLHKLTLAARNEEGKTNATSTELIGLIELFRSYRGEAHAHGRIVQRSETLRVASERLVWLKTFFSDSLQLLVRFLGPLAILLVGAVLIVQGRIRSGDLVSFWGFWMLLVGPLLNIPQFATLIAGGLASASRFLAYFDQAAVHVDRPGAQDAGALQGRIRFESVVLQYANGDRPALASLTLDIPAGTKVALVGPSGAGKTSILRALLRFHSPQSGRILLDDQDLANVTLDSLYRNVGVMMQESQFFDGTVAENLRLAKPAATDDELREALRAAAALAFVESLPLGLATPLGEKGARLSGGEKQRLSLARLFLKRPAILLFDEPTSALDPVSERLIKDAIVRLTEGRTSVVVAHRLSTIREADLILVLREGRVVGRGTHAELLRQNVVYQEFCAQQTETLERPAAPVAAAASVG